MGCPTSWYLASKAKQAFRYLQSGQNIEGIIPNADPSDITLRCQTLHHACHQDPEAKPLSSYGVDSMMAVELRNWDGRDLEAAVAIFDNMGKVLVSAIGDSVGRTQ
ncbi:hypothetical protein GGR53DRAFT_530018 [Hypoxylon sp. FL1150]|nr:hypothetical protein GGR53DRAFT_530018 [Hypoxylon sp. FL1150]